MKVKINKLNFTVRLFLIFGVLIFAGLLSGCAKKNNSINNYHSYKYYKNHKKQAKAVLKMCEKTPAFVNQNSKKFELSKANENCLNAQNVVYHSGNIFQKNFFNAMRREK